MRPHAKVALLVVAFLVMLTAPAWANDEYISNERGLSLSEPTSHFWDIPPSNTELFAASQYVFEAGIARGYADGSLRAYEVLTHRHVFLMLRRAGITTPWWRENYAPITRGELRMLADLPFDSTRWQEGLARAQLLLLLYRQANRDQEEEN
jgi:hypothetical protein